MVSGQSSSAVLRAPNAFLRAPFFGALDRFVSPFG
jgi:hypothetical protein